MSPTEVSLEGLVHVVIDRQFRVCGGQARAASLAETIVDAASMYLLGRPASVAPVSLALAFEN